MLFVLQAPKIIGSTGKVLKSGPNDRVFVYFADHGAPGEKSAEDQGKRPLIHRFNSDHSCFD